MSREDLGLNLNLQFGLADHRHQDILEAPAHSETANVLSPDSMEYRQDPWGGTHQKSWRSSRAPLSLYTLVEDRGRVKSHMIKAKMHVLSLSLILLSKWHWNIKNEKHWKHWNWEAAWSQLRVVQLHILYNRGRSLSSHLNAAVDLALC